MSEYDPSVVESKWQQKWEESKVFEVDLNKAKKKYYSHVMFPYPSGDKLHVGHWYNFGPADSFARFMKMQGLDVFTPIGFDSFGLPAENYAIKTGVHPSKSILENVKTMTEQLKRIGCMYDWSKTVNTSTPEYYKWTQWLFLQMFKNDVAYRKDAPVNFCPGCKTVLANEQVWDGKCERCEAEVVQKPLTQWYWKITDYADRLLEGLDKINWPEKTKTMQRNWIGKKTGIDITYEIKGSDEKIVCFTTRPDTNFGATFIVLAPEHPFAEMVAKENKEVASYIESANKKTELERQEEGKTKTGADTGFVAINNLNGMEMPIWISDFVLGGFGTGAVVGVPGHDIRDFEFAQTFDLPIIRVVVGPDGDKSEITKPEQVQEASGTMVNSDFLDGMEIMKAKDEIMNYMEKKKYGERVVNLRIRDWSISRQRYWGAPIPIVYDPEGEPHAIPEEHLPWTLPTDVEFKPTGTAPLAASKELKERTEKIFGKGWTPEVDTMDTFVCSSYYSYMYLNSSNKKSLVDKKLEKKWFPVDCYIGGSEHACMHLIYARFVTMALKDFGFVNHEEPYQRLVHQGVITNQGTKMSKSKGNVVSPDSFVEKYGSDVFRMYLMFMGPFTDGGDWNDSGIKGIDRFAKRVHSFFLCHAEEPRACREASRSMGATTLLHKTIKKVTNDMNKMQFNTAISSLMVLLNEFEKNGASKEAATAFVKLLSPLAPHLAEELWEMLGKKGFACEAAWPTYDESLLVSDSFTLVVQINGKVRANIEVSSDVSEEEAIEKATADPNVQKFLGESTVKKAIYIQGKIVSFVV